MNKNNALQVSTLALPLGSVETYVHRVNQIPMLTLEEEQALTRRLHEENDVDAARQLVMSHLRFVVRVARGYSGYGLAQADLIQEGNVGLMKAVKRFDPAVGVRLVTFAVHWIKAEIHEFILRNWRIVKIATTKAQRKLFFNLRKMKKRLGWFSQEEIDGVAKDLGVKPGEVIEMESRMNSYDETYDIPAEPDSLSLTGFAPAGYLAAPDSDPADLAEKSNWNDTYQEKLHNALSSLDERSQDILQARWLATKKATLHDLAAKYAVSAERIRQLEQAAISKLKTVISV